MSYDGARKAYLKALKSYQADQYWQAGQDFAAVLRRDPHTGTSTRRIPLTTSP
jgi:hypothetical protein